MNSEEIHITKKYIEMRCVVILLLIMFSFIWIPSIAQDVGAFDTIIKVEGRVMPVNVEKVTSSYVRFKVPGVDSLFTMSRKDIHKVIYKNGRKEEYNPLVLQMIDSDSWKAVWLTENKKDIVDLFIRGKIEVEVPPSSRSIKASKKSAIMRMQKKAAALQGTVILITKKQTTGGYGEFQGYEMAGIIYGTEPLEEENTGY